MRRLFEDQFRAAEANYRDNPDVRVRPGVIADRQARTVEVLAVACGARAGDPTEFLLVTEAGRADEALALTLAQARDIHEALVFVGVQPGHPVDVTRFRQWPKGERVDVFFVWPHADKDVSVPAAEMLVDTHRGATVPPHGWMFVGELTPAVPPAAYLPDDSGEIITDFNSPWTVLDVPDLIGKGEVYGGLLPNPKYLLKLRQPLKIVLKPELPAGERHVLDYAVRAGAAAGAPAATGVAELRFTATDRDGKAVLTDGTFEQLLALLEDGVKAQKDVYLKLAYDDQVPVAALVEFGPLLMTLVQKQAVRLEPDPDQLFGQAFTPDPAWRDPKQRPQQPVELHLAAAGPLRLRYFDEEFLRDGSLKVDEKSQEFASADALEQALAAREVWGTGGVLFFAPPDTAYGTVRQLYLRIRNRFPIAHVFLTEPPPPAPAP